MEPCTEVHRSLVHRGEAARPSYVHIFPAKKRKKSSSLMTKERQSRKMMSSGENEEDVAARTRPLGRAEDVIHAMPADSGALRLEAGSAFRVLNVARK